MKRLLFLLAERCRRVNRVCSELGRLNVCLVSIHVNAAGPANKINGNSTAGQRYGVARSGLVPGTFSLHSKAPVTH